MLIQTLKLATMTAGKIMKENFNSTFNISNKEGINNLVTEIDHKSEAAIIAVVNEHHPGHSILSEETGAIIQDSSIKWIIDPIDGTVNYANGIPICAVSIGIEKEGVMIAGAVYNPFIDEFFMAEKGKGASLNEKSISVSKTKEVVKSCLVTGFPYTYLDSENGPLDVFSRFIKKGIPVRRLGSAAVDLCWVAAGRFDGFYEHKLEVWDSAAGWLIVEEAGGKVSRLDGSPFNPYLHGIIASNGVLHEELVAIVNNKKQL
jgi:myo-inositol-1(or 4)-monophosphatase